MSLGADALRRRALLGLPFTEWARRMRRGSIVLRGRVEPSELQVGGHPLHLDAGPILVEASFLGGPLPTLVTLDVRGALRLVDDKERAAHHLRLAKQRLWLDDHELSTSHDRLGSGRLLAALVRRLADVEVDAHAEPEGDVVLQLGGGVEVCVAEGLRITARAAAAGPPDDLRLARPVELRFGGEGIRLNHERLEWLSRLASVRVARATLHPDGSVALEGGGGRGFDKAVRGSLHTASAGLSALVRRSPAVRRFLRPDRSES